MSESMPRASRIIIANYPHHIIQRGHNRQQVFAAEEEYLYYLENLRIWKEFYECKVYSYCLMTNHVHLIVDPGKKEKHLSQLMKRVTGRQTRYVNKIRGRSGTLWEGRFKSSPISIDEYLLACSRYIEMNPVRAGLVKDPVDYRWSSYQGKIGLRKEEWLDKDPCYLGLAENEKKRKTRYRIWLRSSMPEKELNHIRQSLQRGQLTGSSRFIDEIEGKIKKRVEFRGRGRPRKVGK
jgi:putative transposase